MERESMAVSARDMAAIFAEEEAVRAVIAGWGSRRRVGGSKQ